MTNPDLPALDQGIDTYGTEISNYLQSINSTAENTSPMDGDSGWVNAKKNVIELNSKIQDRRTNYNTYKGQIDMQKELYNGEKNKTIWLSISIVVALGACGYVWIKK